MRLPLIAVIVCAIVHASDVEFKAAVYEHKFVLWENQTDVPTRQEALNIAMQNMDVYEEQIVNAKRQNASIIVFPEYGLTGFVTRQIFYPFLENIPDPTQVEWNPCESGHTDNSTAIMTRLSCLAKDNDIYVVANMGDIKPCNVTSDPHCPVDERYQYNTNVVFDDKGKLIARYHKQHPFLKEMLVVNRPLEPEFVTFDTPFGKFGTFICFDVLFHDPAIPLVEKHHIDHVVFSATWFDVLPLFAAIGFHSSWARGMRVNYLAANTHVPFLQNTGSGIYSFDGAKAFYRSMTENGSLLVASLPVSPRNMTQNTSLININRTLFNVGNKIDPKDEFYSDLFGDLFFFKELREDQGNVTVCYKDTTSCCSLTYKMASKPSVELYVLGVFDGLHTREGQYYIRVCALIKCLDLNRTSCGRRVYNASTIFDSIILKSQLNTSNVFPQVVADGVSLLPGEWVNDYPTSALQTTQQLSKGLLTAALFGRVYDLDPPQPSPPHHTTTPTTPTNPTTKSTIVTPSSSTTASCVPCVFMLFLLLLVFLAYYA